MIRDGDLLLLMRDDELLVWEGDPLSLQMALDFLLEFGTGRREVAEAGRDLSGFRAGRFNFEIGL